MSDNLSPPTLDLLCDELRQVVEWDQVAVSLKVSYVDIKSIETQYSELAQRKMHSLQKWLDQTNTVHSWHTIADAVEKANPAVAENIRTKYATILDLVPSTSQHEKSSDVKNEHNPTSYFMNKEQQGITLNQMPQCKKCSVNDDQHQVIIEEQQIIQYLQIHSMKNLVIRSMTIIQPVLVISLNSNN